MDKIFIKADNISKAFNSKKFIIKDVSLEASNSDVIGIIGENGSGKSTLMKILAANLSPSSGIVSIHLNDTIIKNEDFVNYFGYVAPYLTLYEEFTPIEHIKIFAGIKNIKIDDSFISDLLNEVQLYKHRNKQIKNFSSGMKQRMKFAVAMLGNPKILFLDEPTSNLDDKGINLVKSIVDKFKSMGAIIFVATNDEYEKSWCNSIVSVQNLGN